ncbi:MAG TPA: HAMP domain-containing sensor histidine kinase [Solirubrobacteraceae bacterium]|jgi:signal transduction histidine kinase
MPRPTIRLRLTLLYAGVFLLAGAALLTVSYILVRNNLTAANVAIGGPGDEVRRAVQHEVAGDALHRLRVQYALALAAMTALSVLLGWVVAGRALRGLQQITATARRVSQDTLDERIALEGPRDELKELADTFDEMLERLSGAFASQRRFVANASHELRTPLTVMRTELEVTLADPDATNAELREMAEAVHEAMDRTERLVQALLTLARSEGAVARRDPMDLAAAAQMALEHTARDAQAAGLSVTADLHAAPVRGDRRLLERLVANLVENAVGHNRPGGRVSVTTSTSNGHSIVDVVNDGDALDPATLPRLLEPFQRADRGARGDGAGLGLSIVRSVAQAHGGAVSLAACPDGGLRATVTLPRTEAADLPDPSSYLPERAHA